MAANIVALIAEFRQERLYSTTLDLSGTLNIDSENAVAPDVRIVSQ